jgi:ABC-2 type transport system ATP-binding protein
MAVAPDLLQVDRIYHRLGGREVLREVSFRLRRLEVLGLLGVNGAGKSTTLSIVAGVLKADSGTVRIDGRNLYDDPRAMRKRIGWVPESVPLWPELTVAEALDACGRLRGLARAARANACARVLARLELGAVSGRVCAQLSLGQKRRVGLAKALLHEPELLVLDEPGNGLDPIQTAQLRTLIGELGGDRVIILSSHDLTEVESLCTRVLILHDGRLCHDAPLEAGHGKLDRQFRALVAAPAGAAA